MDKKTITIILYAMVGLSALIFVGTVIISEKLNRVIRLNNLKTE